MAPLTARSSWLSAKQFNVVEMMMDKKTSAPTSIGLAGFELQCMALPLDQVNDLNIAKKEKRLEKNRNRLLFPDLCQSIFGDAFADKFLLYYTF
jgi:hypothetical protein